MKTDLQSTVSTLRESYLKTMGIELLEGRDFRDGDADKVCLMNRQAIKQFQWENFEGNQFNYGNKVKLNVIGVVKDFNCKIFSF